MFNLLVLLSLFNDEIICDQYTLKSQRNWYRHVYANTEICKHSCRCGWQCLYKITGDCTGIRLITAATMAGYHDLSDFERGI